MPPNTTTDQISGRCYCGAFSVSANKKPQTVAYCHCADCKRWTGAPLPAFAAFSENDLKIEPAINTPLEQVAGVKRWMCPKCGSPMAATFDYLPDQIYVPIGILEQANDLAPKIHCHSEQQFSWLHINDKLERKNGSGREKILE